MAGITPDKSLSIFSMELLTELPPLPQAAGIPSFFAFDCSVLSAFVVLSTS